MSSFSCTQLGAESGKNLNLKSAAMNKLLVGLCASICLLSLATDAQAVRLGGRTTIRPHRSYTPPPRTYRPTPANPAIRGFNARQNAASTGSNIPVPLFIPPIIAGHNTTQITDDMYLIKTGMRKQGDKLQFWTLQNHSYTPDSKSAKVQFSMDCLEKIYSPIALATYPELDGKGKQIKSTTFDPKFRPIREKSAMDRLHSLLCPKPAAQQP